MTSTELSPYKEEIKILLTKALSRKYGPMEVRGFHTREIKEFDIPTHSVIGKLEGIEYNVTNGAICELPPIIVAKKYLDSVVLASSARLTSCYNEHNVERGMLGIMERLSTKIGNRTILAYPISYSWNAPECNEKKYIFREYINEDTITKIAKENFQKSQGESKEISWKDARELVGGPLYCIALQHAQTPKILEDISLSFRDPRRILDDLTIYLWKLCDKKQSRDKIQDSIAGPIEVLSKTCFCPVNEKEIVAINGDLDVYAEDVTKTRLLDAGGCEIGHFMRDLVVYSDPVFNPISNLEAEVIEDYKTISNEIRKNLCYPSLEFNTDKMLPVYYADAWKGLIRNASATKGYKQDYFKEHQQTNLEEMFKKNVASHLDQSVIYLRKLIESKADDQTRKAGEEISKVFKDLNLFNGYKEIMKEV
jgi:hypothetical protein